MQDNTCGSLESCVTDFDHTAANRWTANKTHRSLNAFARHQKIVLPPLPQMTKPGLKKVDSSPTSIADWDVKDQIGSPSEPLLPRVTFPVKDADHDSLEVIFSPRHLAPLQMQKTCEVAATRRRSLSPTDNLGTRCACSILKENFSRRFQQERIQPTGFPCSSSL